jgi:hypothetical protein
VTTPAQLPGRKPADLTGWAALGLILSSLATAVGLGLGTLGVLYAGLTLVTGAPGHVQLGGIASAVVVIRGRRSGHRGGRRMAITGLVLGIVCLVGLIVGLPLLVVDPCFDLSCS